MQHNSNQLNFNHLNVDQLADHHHNNGHRDVLPLRPEIARSRRFLFFTNECVGLGHLRRSMGLARAVTGFDQAASALVVTGSPAVSAYPPIARVETAKLPQLARNGAGDLHSPAMVAEAGHVQSMRARLAMTFAETFHPDVIVVDKTPSGINGELLPMLQSVRASGGPRVVLGLRDVEDDPDQVRRTWSAADLRQLIHRFYDAVLVYGPPGSPDALTSLRIENLGVPVHHVGYVAAPLPTHGPADLPDDYLLVTVGGGVDGAEVARVLLQALRLRPLGIPTVLVTGPMMSEAELAELSDHASGLDVVLTRFRADLDAAIVGARAVVTMAGYNTVAEVLRAGRPALLVPRVRPSGEQWVRACMLAEQGLADVMHPDDLEPAAMRSALEKLLARPVSAAPQRDYSGAARAAELLSALARTGPARVWCGRPRGRPPGRPRGWQRSGRVAEMAPRSDRPASKLIRTVIRDHAGALTAAVLASVVVAAADLAAPWPLKWVIDGILGNTSGSFTMTRTQWIQLAVVVAATVAIALAGAAATYVGDVRLQRTGERVAHDLRVRTYTHLQRLSLSFHDRRHKGDLVTHLTEDANRVGEVFSESLGAIAQAALMVVGMMALTLLLDPTLGLALLGVVPVLVVVTLHYRHRVRAAARQQRVQDGEIASAAAETLSAIRLVQASGTETHEQERVRDHSEQRRQHGVVLAGLEARFSGVVDVVGAVAAAIVIVVGTVRVAQGALTPGAIVVMAAYARRLYRPLKDMAKHSTRIGRAMSRAERIADVLAADEILTDRPNAFTGGRAAGRIELQDVHFSYEPGRTALNGVDLAIPAGSRVAVVGASGAGKSTIGALITRFYDPAGGRILLDDHDLRDCSLRWVRDQIGVLLQDTVLLSGTIRDNIAYGTDAGLDEVVSVARSADADRFIAGLADGYDTVLGAQGVGLSGGQRQRIGIARVLLKNPPVLVLDEPTTGLDAASEATVMDSLEALMRGRTTVLITHSMALATKADRVVVIQDGRVTQDAAPQELLGQPGLFRRLAREQGLLGRPNRASLAPSGIRAGA